MFLINIPNEFGIKKKRYIQKQLIFEPQYNHVTTSRYGKGKDFEYGVNAGFRFIHQSQWIDYYFQVNTGPRYISSRFFNQEGRAQQRGGLILSDNLALGLRKKFGNSNIHSEYRFRHLSNANLKQLNAGINNFIVILGVG